MSAFYFDGWSIDGVLTTADSPGPTGQWCSWKSYSEYKRVTAVENYDVDVESAIRKVGYPLTTLIGGSDFY